MKVKKKILHLICNSHIDPVWLWRQEEGIAETISTFRIAAGFCEKFDGFIFCHNEALLYKWIELFDKSLFRKIRELVKTGQWHIMGGWYNQPDCNMPSGEAIVRQIIVGNNYFIKKFDVKPSTAVNLDPFGHSRGLVQILAKSGYDSYLFCRPDNNWLKLPDNLFNWKGYDESVITCIRAAEHYNSEDGQASEKIKSKLYNLYECDILLWGVGNHGGGPSERDIIDINELRAEKEEFIILHSTPEKFVNDIAKQRTELKLFSKSLNPWAVGCYTSMARIKKLYRQLENEYFKTEKILSASKFAYGNIYDKKSMDTVLESLLFVQFHDSLPGSATKEVEKDIKMKIFSAMDKLNFIKYKALFNIADRARKAKQNEIPFFIYNHHSHDINDIFEIELQVAEPNTDKEYNLLPVVTDSKDNIVDIQIEKESSNINNDHRKKIVFNAKLKASTLNSYYCVFKKTPKMIIRNKVSDDLIFNNGKMRIELDKTAGLINSYKVNGIEFIKTGTGTLDVIYDNADPWGMKVDSFNNIAGQFRLMNETESAEFSGIEAAALEPVRIIENGSVRTIVEALFIYNNSCSVVHYHIPKDGTEIKIDIEVYWNEKDKFLKYSLPMILENPSIYSQSMYGTEEDLPMDKEHVMQKWCAVSSAHNMLTVINKQNYGFDFSDNKLRLSLLRSPAYAAHPVEGENKITKQDRFIPRMDQGNHNFTFYLNAGSKKERVQSIENEALLKNESPEIFTYYPAGNIEPIYQILIVDNEAITVNAMKKSDEGNDLLIRLFESSGKSNNTNIYLPFWGINKSLKFKAFEIKTLKFDLRKNSIKETDLLENSSGGFDA